MENSAFVASASHHITSPALVVFSQAAGGLSEALRIQRPSHSHSQMSDPSGKEMHNHNPFTAAAASFAGFRHMDMYNGLPAQLLHHLQPQFLHPGLPFGSSGAFRPLVELKTFPSPSAFAPPNKCLKISTSPAGDVSGSVIGGHTNHNISNIFSPPSDERSYLSNQSRDSMSPASASLSPPLAGSRPGSGPGSASGTNVGAASGNSGSDNGGNGRGTPAVKQENFDHQSGDGNTSDRNHTPGPGPGRGSGNSTPNNLTGHDTPEHRGFRMESLYGTSIPENGYNFSLSANPHDFTKGRFLFEQGGKPDTSCCPVCGVCVGPGELESHFLQELERLCKLSCNPRGHSFEGQHMQSTINDSAPDHRWETFQRIKNNRQDRLRIKSRKRKVDEATCPICSRRMQRTPEELNAHVGQCLRKHGMNPPHHDQDEDETVDVEGDSKMYEEVSWAEDLRRSRTTNILFPGTTTPSSSSGRMSVEREAEPEDGDEEDLIVDGDDPRASPSQYSDSEAVVSARNQENVERDRVICSPDGAQQSQVSTVNSSADVDIKSESTGSQQCDSNVSTSDAEPSSRAQLLEELKARIRELEENASNKDTETADDHYKCLICMEHYKNPVISTVCWHVHCEECWLHTLGTKKLCPQCSMITTTSDLRRIFI